MTIHERLCEHLSYEAILGSSLSEAIAHMSAKTQIHTGKIKRLYEWPDTIGDWDDREIAILAEHLPEDPRGVSRA